MARITSLNVLLDPTGKDFLAELYGKVIQNVEMNTISSVLKNTDLSGTPTSGTVEAKRFANAASANYGTARTAGKGAGIKAKPVVISIDVDKEIVEEMEEKDTALYGVDGVLGKRAVNHQRTMIRELERAFFATAIADGTAVTSAATAIQKLVEESIQQLETTKNSYVDGVPRDMINVVCSPATYGALREYLDNSQQSNINTAAESIDLFHGVRIYSSIYLPAKTNFIVMADGAVAQPVLPKPYTAEKIPLSNAYGVSLFYSYGTKSVMPDLILKSVTP